MKKRVLASLLIGLTQLTFAQGDASTTKPKKIEGCVYGNIVYQVGVKHSVQQAVTDPATNKTTMVDLEPKIVQECMEDKNADKTKSPRFYWRTLPN